MGLDVFCGFSEKKVPSVLAVDKDGLPGLECVVDFLPN
jgi:hypothetical protein